MQRLKVFHLSGYFSDLREQSIALWYQRSIAEKMRTCLGHVTTEDDRADRVRIPNIQEIEAQRITHWQLFKVLASLFYSSKQKHKSESDNIKEKLITDRENARLWEKLGWHLAMDKDSYCESIEALSHAESRYRDRGDIAIADDLAKKISLNQSNLKRVALGKVQFYRYLKAI